MSTNNPRPPQTLEAFLRSARTTSQLPEEQRKHPMSEWIRRSGLSRQHFYNLLNGRVKTLSNEVVGALAKATGVSDDTIRNYLRGSRRAYELTQ